MSGGAEVDFQIRLFDLDGDAPLSIQVFLDGTDAEDLVFEADSVKPDDFDPDAEDTDIVVDTDTGDTATPEEPASIDLSRDPEGSLYVTFSHRWAMPPAPSPSPSTAVRASP